MEPINTLQLTDQELEMLSSIIRGFKMELTSEDTLLIALGKKKLPVLELTLKVAQAWEQRLQELQQPSQPQEAAQQ